MTRPWIDYRFESGRADSNGKNGESGALPLVQLSVRIGALHLAQIGQTVSNLFEWKKKENWDMEYMENLGSLQLVLAPLWSNRLEWKI